jgi:hypothetical protein
MLHQLSTVVAQRVRILPESRGSPRLKSLRRIRQIRKAYTISQPQNYPANVFRSRLGRSYISIPKRPATDYDIPRIRIGGTRSELASRRNAEPLQHCTPHKKRRGRAQPFVDRNRKKSV